MARYCGTCVHVCRQYKGDLLTEWHQQIHQHTEIVGQGVRQQSAHVQQSPLFQGMLHATTTGYFRAEPNRPFSSPARRHRCTYRCDLAAAACHKEFVKGISHLLAHISQTQTAAVPAGAQTLRSVALTQHSTCDHNRHQQQRQERIGSSRDA